MQFWDEPCSNRPFEMELRIMMAAEMEYAALQCVIAPIGPGLQVDGDQEGTGQEGLDIGGPNVAIS